MKDFKKGLFTTLGVCTGTLLFALGFSALNSAGIIEVGDVKKKSEEETKTE